MGRGQSDRSVEGVDEMASMKRPRLQAVQPRSGASLELTFTNGQHFILDMSDALKAYPGLAPLAQ